MSGAAKLIEFFRGRAPEEIASLKKFSVVTDDFEDADGIVDDSGSSDHDLVGLTIGIEYCDSAGNLSQRNITIEKFFNKEDKWYITGYCFLRKRLRQFRLDRISSMYNQDGEFMAPSTFFNVIGLTYKEPSNSKLNPGAAHRKIARDGMRALMGLARIDGFLHEDEIEVILCYAEEEGAAAATKRLAMTEEDRVALTMYLKNLQPHGDVVSSCLDRLISKGDTALKTFFWYARKVMDADRVQHVNEVTMILDISSWIEGRADIVERKSQGF